jgi:bifunctional non-homologous end joining protein LigD
MSIVELPKKVLNFDFKVRGRMVTLTNLTKLFWPELGITKRDVLQYYLNVSTYLLPHLKDRAMVMKRYPNGAHGDYFFMKRAPTSHPSWLKTCSIEHASGSVIDFPVIQDVASLLWIVNLGCIDLNPWYGRCPNVDRPDYFHFDLDPMPGVSFKQVCDAAFLVKQKLDRLRMPSYPKTTGSRGLHIYVPIKRGPLQKEVWSLAKQLAIELADENPKVLTAQYRINKRPAGRVLVDYNQNAWGRTLASVYSIRPKPKAPVSMPVTWQEIKKGIHIDDFRIDNAFARIKAKGDLWKPVDDPKNRFDWKTLP